MSQALDATLSDLWLSQPMPGTESDSGPRAPTLADSFPPQWEYVTSSALFNAVCCSRRAGKTVGAVLRTARLLATKPGSRVHYVTLIRRNCRKYFWWPLQAELARLGWKFEANETDLILQVENGSWVQAIGVDDIGGVKAVKGDRTDLFMLDEAQENLDDVMRALIDVAATPMLTDTGGMLDLLGTVPETEPSFFSEALDSPGWAHFHWTMFDHDHPRPRDVKRAAVEDIIKARGLTWDSVLVRREYLGERIRDPSLFAYEYAPGRNDYDPETVDFARGKWRHTMGIDIGFQDADAIEVVGWDAEDPTRTLYERFSWAANHGDVDQLHDKVKEVLGEFRISAIVGDHGGHGATKVLKTLEQRLGVPILAKPGDVMVSVGLVNDDFRTSRLKLLHGGDLAAEIGKVTRTVQNGRVVINKKGFHSDRSEALRYAHSAALHYRAKAPRPEPTRDDMRIERWQQQRREERNPWR